MKKFIVLIFIASLLFAVKPVPHGKDEDDGEQSKTKAEKVVVPKDNKQTDKKDNGTKDYFIDVNSNGVNDQREDDLQKIKQLGSKHKDLLKKNDNSKQEPEKKVIPAKKSKSSSK